MSLRMPNFHHRLPSSPSSRTQGRVSILHLREWKRRKLKLLKPAHTAGLAIRSKYDFNFFVDSSAFENLFLCLISQFPSVNSLDIFAPALGLASGAAIFFSRSGGNSKFIPNFKERRSEFVGEWILFTSPTPFNRFVVLRCPSITFEGGELLEDVNEKLVQEERHFVRLSSGRIPVRESELEEAEKLVYQRVCVGTDDGGVISLDWPANLNLEEERGLDTTILIVPGTTEGSKERKIKDFVIECLRRGFFPVVMNPRGCAGSPLTTPRLFTAADSDDISTAIQFINKARPWTTMMSIGWGYGANMLTKYLAEVGERTPLTAATCIDNPFDLEETTRSAPHHILLDQKLKTGLIDILRSNKELFQGHAKRFDVEKALLATSVRDFEKAISMVSYGFDEIEEFYANLSTRGMVGKVKIPLLFIQNDNGTIPLFSTPRSVIVENPFTSLLLCSYLPSREFTSSRSTVSWCQQVTIEWLTAVELGLLKGRHPLLKDIDVTINPSKGLAMLESGSHKKGKLNKLLSVPNLDDLDANSINHVKTTFEGSYLAADFPSRKESKGLQKGNMDSLENSKGVDADLTGKEMMNSVDDERGQALQTAKVVINMLDMTMPDTLTEEQKKKVLTAVDRGESIIKALQDAVPEDVRGKLTAALSEIINNQESTLKLDRLLSLGRIPEVASILKSKIQEKSGFSNANVQNVDTSTSAETQIADQADDSKSQPSQDDPPRGPESETQAAENAQKSVDSGQLQPTIRREFDTPDSEERVTDDLGNNKETAFSSREETNQVLDSKGNSETWSQAFAKPELSNRPEGAGSAADKIIGQHNELDSETSQSAMKVQSGNQQNEVKTSEASVDQTKSMPSGHMEDKHSTPVSVSESQAIEREGWNTGAADISKLPNFEVSQALDALTGIDDSTQVAVNSVFNLIEDMITQLEEGKVDANQVEDVSKKHEDRGTNIGNEFKERVEVQEQKIGFIPEMREANEKYKSLPSNTSYGMNSSNQINFTEQSASDSSLFLESNTDHSKGYIYEANGRVKDFVSRKLSAQNHVERLNSIRHPGALPVPTNLYGDHLYREFLQKYLVLRMRNHRLRDLDSSLFLDYVPEEGKWKLLEQSEDDNDISDDAASHGEVDPAVQTHLTATYEDTEDIIEPSYVILDSDKQEEQVEKFEREIDDGTSEELLLFAKSIILDTLKVEVDRRVSATDIEEIQPKLTEDLELVANAVSQSLRHGERTFSFKGKGHASDKFCILEGLCIVNAISSSFQKTSYLRKLLPVGVIVGSSLAALRKYFDVSLESSNSQMEGVGLDPTQQTTQDDDKMVYEKMEQKKDLNSVTPKIGRKTETSGSNGNPLMVGAVTAALGASALLLEQQNSGTTQTLSKSFKEKDGDLKGLKNEEKIPENTPNIVTSLAEKALLVASPVVPTKEDGEVDHERLVEMLAELGQKGGILKLVAKIALLWGGIRGALSLTDKLISFLRMAEQPLFQRIFGFAFMVIVLWLPVVVPLLPTLVQSWAKHGSARIAELACRIGLYVSVMLMVTLWGKRIRGYDNPLEKYGLDLTLSKVQYFVKGLLGGVLLVSLINYVNFFCGYVRLSGTSYLPALSSNAVAWLKVCGKTLLLVFQGLTTATGIAVVEELLFRSWLPEEIAADMGYYRGIIISGLAFSLSQRSLWAIPGLWLLSVGLSGARQRSHGSLYLPIGLRAGILASCFILQRGGFLTYNPSSPVWLCGAHPSEPFSGIIGLAFSVLLTVILYPRQRQIGKEVS